jgi:hypothetical protein
LYRLNRLSSALTGSGILIIGKPPMRTFKCVGSTIAPMLPVGGNTGTSFHIIASTCIFARSIAIWAAVVAASSALPAAIAASSSTAASAMSAAYVSAPAAMPPYCITLLATPAAFPMAAITFPAVMEGFSGITGQALQMSVVRAARTPPIKTFDEPVFILNHATGSPQHVGARPISSTRAAGMELMRTRVLTPRVTAPMLGIGVGGTGGGPLGGCATCACGVPMYGEPIVAAGRLGNIAAIGAVRLAKPTSNALLISVSPPKIAPTVCCVARIARAAT